MSSNLNGNIQNNNFRYASNFGKQNSPTWTIVEFSKDKMPGKRIKIEVILSETRDIQPLKTWLGNKKIEIGVLIDWTG
jgi:hypothetical protein